MNEIPQSKPPAPFSPHNSSKHQITSPFLIPSLSSIDNNNNRNTTNNIGKNHYPDGNYIKNNIGCSSSGSHNMSTNMLTEGGSITSAPLAPTVRPAGHKRSMENDELSLEAKRRLHQNKHAKTSVDSSTLNRHCTMPSSVGSNLGATSGLINSNSAHHPPCQPSPHQCITNGVTPSTSAVAVNTTESLRMKIKRKKMTTRQSGPNHEVLKQQEESSDPFGNTSAINGDGSLLSPHTVAQTSSPCPIRNIKKEDDEKMEASHNAEQISTDTPKFPMDRKPLRRLDNDNIKQTIRNKINVESLEKYEENLEKCRDAGTWVRTVGGITEADCLGPCDPGTSVILEGIVWNETSSGVLVVNVTWRGKSYVGTLLDCSKSEWSAPRFCESPNVGHDDVTSNLSKSTGSNGGGKGRHLKRNNNSSLHLNLNSAINSNCNLNANSKESSPSSRKPPLISNTDAITTPASGPPLDVYSSTSSTAAAILEPCSPLLVECPSIGCEKKYDTVVALRYHQNTSHRAFHRSRTDAATWTLDDNEMMLRRDVSHVGITVDLMDSATAPVNPATPGCSARSSLRQLSPHGTKKLLSDAENASLESLFNVVGGGAAKSSPPSPNIVNNGRAPDLGPPRTAPPPQAEKSAGQTSCDLSCGRAAASVAERRVPSPAFSDVSDAEEAPILERHLSPLAEPSRKGPIIDGLGKCEPANQIQGMTKSSSSSNRKQLPAYQSLKASGVKPEPLPSPLPPPMANHVVVDRPSPQKLGQSFPPQPYNTAPYVPFSSGTLCAPALLPPHMLPFDHPAASLLYAVANSTGNMFPPPFPVPMTSALGPHVIGPPFYAPPPSAPTSLPLPMGSNLRVASGSPHHHHNNHHKIHQLTESSQQSGGALQPNTLRQQHSCAAVHSNNNHMVTPSKKESKSSVPSGDDTSKLRQSPLTSNSDLSEDGAMAKSPPVQRHHHLHHHTHSYPALITPVDSYTAMIAGQQAAAAGIVTAYPSFVGK